MKELISEIAVLSLKLAKISSSCIDTCDFADIAEVLIRSDIYKEEQF